MTKLIERGLGSAATTIRLKGEDELNAVTTDVSRVIAEGIKNLESYWGQPGGLGYLRNLLESSADRTFLWVSHVLEILEENEDDSQEEFTNIATTTPCDLAELYTKILNKSTNPTKARRILQIVVAAARPLTLQEMNVALKITQDHRSIEDLEDLRPGFEKTIYLVHQTAREFLLKGTLSGHGEWRYTLCPVDSSFMLANICISYLSLQDFETNPSAMDTLSIARSARSSRGARRDVVYNYVRSYALLDYAANHWAGHFRDSQERQFELFEPTRFICKGGSNRLSIWLMAYWENSHWFDPFPNDFIDLMIAVWLGQRRVVGRVLEEGGDINARSALYGTALNVVALRKDEDITRMLSESGVNAYICGKGYKIPQVMIPPSMERTVYR
ncbi:hypothetical protein C7212DRAFT_347543 [Tuber magnatum]|uniref:GPI inositol-deacylase winged helix domain-containing protein n=1 Tax=Tuber magnatum TaxID=42249 RepID=A0A317SFW7_9PEZI|nr:hypothetical protein C7212DRAFT_347543 [Tuber magnatum]